jgi:hypothetical protein
MTTSIQRFAILTLIVLLGVCAIGGAQVDTWTTKADMPTAREPNINTAAVVDGKIYVIGGFHTGVGALSTVEAYDPSTDTWTQKADMPTACAVAKRYKRMPRRRSTLEKRVVKHLPYPDRVTGWGV